MNNPVKSCVVKVSIYGGHYATVSESDLDKISQYKWRLHNEGYAITKVRQKTVRMHRLIMDAPAGAEVDHIDGDPLNNSRENLRLCNRAQNMANRRKFTRGKSASKFIGVSPLRGKTTTTWCARIRIDGKNTHIGSYPTEETAARAYDDFARRVHGQFARLNFPNGRCFYCGTALCDGHKDAA